VIEIGQLSRCSLAYCKTRLLTRSFRAAPLPLACCLAIAQCRFSTAALGTVRSLASAPAAYRVLTSLRGGGSGTNNMSTSAASDVPSESTKRGAFILFEGVDRCGKTTQCKLLLERLRAEGHDAVQMRFPGTRYAASSARNGVFLLTFQALVCIQ
jgi:Thymidylate kinase